MAQTEGVVWQAGLLLLKTVRQGSGTERVGKKWVSGLVVCLLVGLITAGLYRSFQVVAFVPPDADRATPAVVAEALLTHGLTALNAWHSTQDNWLLSVILPQFPVYALLGQQPWLPALCGWLGFVATCALCGVLVTLVSAPRPAPWRVGLGLFGMLLFLNPLALGPVGFLAHPASHGMTCFWGLAALVPCVLVLKGASRWLLALTTLLLLVAAISDPWARAAFVLPLTLAGVGLSFLLSDPQHRKTALWLSAITLPVWLAGAHGFGLFPGIPGTQFTKGPLADIPHHAALGFSGLAILLHMVPGTSALSQPWARWVDLAGLCGLGVLASVCFARTFRKMVSPTRIFLALFCVLSLGITFSAFCLSALATDLSTTRLLGQFAFLVPLLLALALPDAACTHKTRDKNRNNAEGLTDPVPEESAPLLAKNAARQSTGNGWAMWLRATVACAGAGFVLAGLFPAADMLSEQDESVARVKRLFTFLQTNRLTQGYGAYWATQANASRLLSAGAVTIRPVAMKGNNLIEPRDQQVFDAWYRAEEHPHSSSYTPPSAAVREFFIPFPDEELCAETRACMALARRNFGEPDETLMWDGTPIMIWHKALFPTAPSLGDRQHAPLLAYQTGQEQRIAVTPETAPPLLWQGWASVGPDGAWSDAQHAGLMLRLQGEAAPVCLTLRASGKRSAPAQALRVQANGATVAQWAVQPATPRTYCTAPLPAGEVYLVLDRAPPPHDNQRLLPGMLLSALSRPHG
ncbi:hypothetical protein [Acetobacter pasteurianus]|uniref:Uncharacterized protein n=1 Tax=Acetobacter pasteurianus NBRC 3188 TaxID=1226663 RepID=A0A401WZ09_ACEPA|nr:hypothetical protein [Acetobacter pasteurianus]GCD54563.1 hypothetical protein NBRC3188_3260 [Acetobacter pasteurianus NBRC 3188]